MFRPTRLVVLLVVLLGACSKGGNGPTAPPGGGGGGGGGGTNHNPTLSVNTSTTHLTYAGTATITVSASDPDGDQLTFAYAATGGSVFFFNDTATTETYTAGN